MVPAWLNNILISPNFSNNNLNATNSFELWLKEDDLDGLPDLAKETAKKAAQDKKRDDEYLITLHMPSYFPFMKYAKNEQQKI